MKRFLALTFLCTMPVATASFAEPTVHNPATMRKPAAIRKPAMPKSAAAAGTIVSIAMPGDLNEYKDGPGVQVVQTNCATCHSAGYVSMQPPMDADHWTKTVTKMRKQYGAPISDADAEKIATYLGKEYGPNPAQ